MAEYWLISAPGEKTCQQTWETLNNVTNKQNDLCKNFKFHIPDLKVGTLDQLVGLSDELTKLDTYVEIICHKLAASLQDTLENKHNSVIEHLQANGQDIPSYLTKFQWDLAKYPIKQSLKSLHDIINKKISDIDNELKTKAAVYNSLKGRWTVQYIAINSINSRRKRFERSAFVFSSSSTTINRQSTDVGT